LDLNDWFEEALSRKCCFMIYLLKMRNFKANYMKLVFEKVVKITK
jgi:hypothetical protein